MTVVKYVTAVGGDTVSAANENIAAGTSTAAAPVPLAVATKTGTATGHDCPVDLLKATPAVNHAVQRRSDDTANQNVYKTSGDTAAAAENTGNAADILGVSVARGSASAALTIGSGTAAATNDVFLDKSTVDGTTKIELAGTIAPVIAANEKVFIQGYGPFNVDAMDTAKMQFNGVAQIVAIQNVLGATDVATGSAIHFTVGAAATAGGNVRTGGVLLIGGRRYRVRSRAGDAGTLTSSSFTLSETFAGGQLRQVCAGCATELAAGKLKTNRHLDDIPVGAMLTISKTCGIDNAATVTTAVAEPGTPAVTEISIGASLTRLAAGTTYQYVAQCSNRGSCDASTGLCKCFKGYSNDNCDTQNMLAA